MSYEFKVVSHSILPGSEMIEFWRDGVFVAGIYPHQDGIRVVSKTGSLQLSSSWGKDL